MICHKNKIIFIHIPKCAGSSVETMFGYKPFDIHKSNRNNLLGWDNDISSFLQHVSTSEIFKYGLISKGIWEEYNKFSITRNPWDRARSSYTAIMNDTKINDTFENFLYRKGKFKSVLTDKNNHSYRGHYNDTQINFIRDHISDIKIFKFEGLHLVNDYFKGIGIDKKIPHTNKTPNPINSNDLYSNKDNVEMVREIYYEDINEFDYKF